MRTAALTLLGSLVLSAAAMPANASLTIAKYSTPTVSNIVEVSGGCGPQYYRDVYGYCRPYYYGYTDWYGYSDRYGYPYPYRQWQAWHYQHRDH
jgi:hypothetical protein